MIKVSVIIPVYNTEDYIAACLDSVIEQDMSSWEIICIDDASTDNSADIMQKYALQDNRIRLIKLEKNGGQAAGRNIGLREARGEYVYFLDSDDMLRSNALSELCRIADQEQVEGIIFDAEDVFDSPELKQGVSLSASVAKFQIDNGVISGENLFLKFCSKERASCQPGRYLWRHSYLLDNGIFNDEETSPHEDELFCLRAVLTAKKMMALPKAFHLRRYRDGSVMTGRTFSHELRHCRSYLLLWLRCSEFLRKHKFDDSRCAMEALNYVSVFLTVGLNYAKKFSQEELIELKFNSPVDAMLLRGVVLESIQERRSEIFMNSSDLHRVINKERIFLYGAGVCGQKMLQLLLQYGCSRNKIYFVVTDKKDKTNVAGFPLYDLGSLENFDDEKDVIILAVTRCWQDEIVCLLDERHFSYIVLKEGYAVMQSPNSIKV